MHVKLIKITGAFISNIWSKTQFSITNTVKRESRIQMQQKSNHWSEKNFSPIIHCILIPFFLNCFFDSHHSRLKSVEIYWFSVYMHEFSIKTEPLKQISGSILTENR